MPGTRIGHAREFGIGGLRVERHDRDAMQTIAARVVLVPAPPEFGKTRAVREVRIDESEEARMAPAGGEIGKSHASKAIGGTLAKAVSKSAETSLAATVIAPVKANVDKAGSVKPRHSKITLAKTNGTRYGRSACAAWSASRKFDAEKRPPKARKILG